MLNFQTERAAPENDFARYMKASDYTLRYLVHHLREATNHDRLYRLLVGNQAWMEHLVSIRKLTKRLKEKMYRVQIEVAKQQSERIHLERESY